MKLCRKKLHEYKPGGCEECKHTRKRNWKKNNPEKVAVHSQTNYIKNKEKRRLAHLLYYEKNKHKIAERNRLPEVKAKRTEYTRKYNAKRKFIRIEKTYGLTEELYQGMLESQNNVCAICQNPETAKDPRSNKVKDLAIDHDHITNKVRGLLCGKCNHAFGLVKESIRTLENMIAYAKKHKP